MIDIYQRKKKGKILLEPGNNDFSSHWDPSQTQSVNVCTFVGVGVLWWCLCVCLYTCMCTWLKARGQPWVLFLKKYFFEPLGPRDQPNRLVSLARPPRVLPAYLPRTGITGTCHHALIFMRGWGPIPGSHSHVPSTLPKASASSIFTFSHMLGDSFFTPKMRQLHG